MSSNVSAQQSNANAAIYETSASGRKLERISETLPVKGAVETTINPDKRFQRITGFGGSFTQASAYLLNGLSKANRGKNIKGLFC